MDTPRSEDVLATCRALGFAEAGIARVEPTRWAEELTRWLDDGKHGQMTYLSEQLADRLDPQRVLPGARSAIMVLDQYGLRDGGGPPPPPGRGRIARYARGRDYHEVLRKRLHRLADTIREQHPGAQTRSFVDTAPVLERELAARAGLGWIAKNTMLINPRLGSYVFLGGVLTTLDLAASGPHDPATFAVPDHCGTCTRCIDACPTRAITPYSVDGSRCISYLTIEHRTLIDPGLHGAVGAWLYGCDICQDVCPHNSAREGSRDTGVINPDYEANRDSFDILGLLNWNEDTRRSAFASSPMKRATLGMMKRNALIIAGNLIAGGAEGGGGDRITALAERVRSIAADGSEPELVRQTARQVLDRLGV